MNNEKMITAIYMRVSTEDQAKDGFSIHAQKNKLTKYAEVNDWDIYDYYVDDGISGKNLTGRPEVTRMIDDVKNGKVTNVLVYKLDRLTRSVRDLIDLIEIFESHNCCFNSVTEKIDTSNAVGRMFVKIIGIFAEFERENLAERVAFGYEQKTKEGNYTNPNGVYGYDYVIGEGKLLVNEEEKALVNRIFDEYIDGKSYFKIACTLNVEGVPTKRGGNWAPGTILSIIHNPLYIGKVRYGVSPKNKDKSFVVDGKGVPSIVDIDKWNLAQDIVSTRKKYSIRRYPSENCYFSHMIKCSKCGSCMSARQQSQSGKKYITYRCNKAGRKACDASGFSHIKMEEAFEKYLSNIKNFEPTIDVMENKKKENNIKETMDKINQKIDKLNNKKKAIRTEFINETISIDEYKNFINEIDDKIDNLKNEFSLNSKKLDEVVPEISYNDIKNIVTNIKLNWEHLTNKERQQFLERFVKKIKVSKIDDKVIIDSVEFKR